MAGAGAGAGACLLAKLRARAPSLLAMAGRARAPSLPVKVPWRFAAFQTQARARARAPSLLVKVPRRFAALQTGERKNDHRGQPVTGDAASRQHGGGQRVSVPAAGRGTKPLRGVREQTI